MTRRSLSFEVSRDLLFETIHKAFLLPDDVKITLVHDTQRVDVPGQFCIVVEGEGAPEVKSGDPIPKRTLLIKEVYGKPQFAGWSE